MISGNLWGTNFPASLISLLLPSVNGRELKGQVKGLPDINQLNFDLYIDELNTSYADLQSLLPANSLPKGLAPWQKIQLRTHISGTTDRFLAAPFDLTTQSGPELHGRITAQGLPNIKKTTFLFQIDNFTTAAGDWAGFVSDTLPAMLSRLGDVRTNGTFEGSIYTFSTDLQLRTDIGLLSSNIAADFTQDYTDASYQGTVSLDEFDLGAFLQDSLLGQFTLVADVKGAGLQAQAINSSVDARVAHFTYKNYTYDSLMLDGQLKEGVFFN